jgi:hypothetical protein
VWGPKFRPQCWGVKKKSQNSRDKGEIQRALRNNDKSNTIPDLFYVVESNTTDLEDNRWCFQNTKGKQFSNYFLTLKLSIREDSRIKISSDTWDLKKLPHVNFFQEVTRSKKSEI